MYSIFRSRPLLFSRVVTVEAGTRWCASSECRQTQVKALDAPAMPPESRLPAKNLPGSRFASNGQKILLYVSLNAKLNAVVGK